MSKEDSPVIAWFRQDLRLADNPALTAAVATGQPVLPVYVLDDDNAGEHRMGAASRWWLHRSLAALDASLHGKLHVTSGDAEKVLNELLEASDATAVFWNRCYEPWRIARDTRIKAGLRERGLTAESFDGSVLFPPQGVSKQDGTPYRVFTPYYRKGCLETLPAPREPLPAPAIGRLAETALDGTIDALALLPTIPWYESFEADWSPGEAGAQQRLERFVASGIKGYKPGRDRPDQEHVSRLSPHLHFGEVSPHQAWHAVERSDGSADDIDSFQSELGWREFSQYLLYHFPNLPHENFQSKFDAFPWRDDDAALERWQRGMTGYPIVDAGMRELWQTGYMHNRVRMIVASFLVKNLMLHWHHGERWFWDTLLDADLGNNSASWQWVAGSGADAAPYFRIFNPVTQGRKFDPHGDYVRTYVPEIAALPDRDLQAPWEAGDDVLADAGVCLGETYPSPMVELKASRQRALDAFKALSAG